MIKNSIFSTLIFAASNVFLCGSSMANDVILTSDSLSYCMNIGSISEPNYECGLSKKILKAANCHYQTLLFMMGITAKHLLDTKMISRVMKIDISSNQTAQFSHLK